MNQEALSTIISTYQSMKESSQRLQAEAKQAAEELTALREQIIFRVLLGGIEITFADGTIINVDSRKKLNALIDYLEMLYTHEYSDTPRRGRPRDDIQEALRRKFVSLQSTLNIPSPKDEPEYNPSPLFPNSI